MLVELRLVEQRYQAVLEVLNDGATVIDVARRHEVARQTVHGWPRKYAASGLAGLADVSWRGPKGDRAVDLFDGADLAGDGADLPVIGVIMLAIAALVVAVLAVLFVIPALIFVLELVLVLAAVGLGVLGRVLFRRHGPWRHV